MNRKNKIESGTVLCPKCGKSVLVEGDLYFLLVCPICGHEVYNPR